MNDWAAGQQTLLGGYGAVVLVGEDELSVAVDGTMVVRGGGAKTTFTFRLEGGCTAGTPDVYFVYSFVFLKH